MRNRILFILAVDLTGCGPSVEIERATSNDPRPRPEACNAGAAPKLVSAEQKQISPEMSWLASTILDPKSNHVLIIGGLITGGVHGNRVGLLDLNTFEHHFLSVQGDAVDIPALAPVIWDSENDRAIVMGGSTGGADISQVISVHVEGENAIIRKLPDFPAGTVWNPGMAYDPIGKRMLATAWVYADFDKPRELAYRATYALDLTPGHESWSTLVSGEMGPPQPELGDMQEMVYDRAHDQMVLVRTGTKTTLGQAWVLDMREPKQWIGLSETFPLASVTTPMMSWDEYSCSFLYFTRSFGACGFDAWKINAQSPQLDVTSIDDIDFGQGGLGYGAVIFDAAKDRILIVGGSTCLGESDFSSTVEIIGVER